MTTYDPPLLEKYAELAVRVGVNLEPGQRLLITGVPLQLAPLARLVAKHAYLAGARFVDVEWLDERIDRIRVQFAPAESLHEFADWSVQLNTSYFAGGDAVLAIVGEDPDLMAGQDPDALETVNKVRAEKMAPMLAHVSAGSSNWSMIAGATAGWSRRVLPQLDSEAAEARLWEVIFDVCRVRSTDVVATWQQHICDLGAREAYLNARAYRKLHFKGPGTDLTMGLPAGHCWRSAGMVAKNGIRAVVNIPTEEVFTMPHRDQIDGVVSSTKPLSYAGSIIEDFRLIFENGRVTKAVAEKGESLLHNLLDVDYGARSLGEVALVPQSSPIARSKLLFYNTLFDENASSHLALGAAYKYSLRDGETMSADSFGRAGGNESLIHVDFMVGSAELDIDGVVENCTAEPIMRGGEWAFEV